MDSPVWFITGASSGLGLEIAKQALSRGHKVIGAARNSLKLAQLASLGATTMTLDVTGPEDEVAAKIREAHALHGKLTHVVNGAGYALTGAVEESTAEEIRAMYETNVFGATKVCRAAAPLLRAQGYGVMANFGSLGSWRGFPASAHYCATKFAVTGFTEGLADELRPFGITVCVIEPGYFRTSFLQEGYTKRAAQALEAYQAGPTGDMFKLLKQVNNNQPGDPAKGAKAIVDVFTKSGVAEDRDIPLRLAIGSDAVATIEEKCKNTLHLVDEWREIACSTDF